MAGYAGWSGGPARQGSGSGRTGVTARNAARDLAPSRTVDPVNPYDSIPPLKPIDNSWYQRQLNELNQLALQQAQQQAAYQRQLAAQQAGFATEYQQQLQGMRPVPRDRRSKLYVLGGY